MQIAITGIANKTINVIVGLIINDIIMLQPKMMLNNIKNSNIFIINSNAHITVTYFIN
jgi:hypothetical protein